MRPETERILALEQLFAAENYKGTGNSSFYIEEGRIPIMLSAPHAVSCIRRNACKREERFTGGMVRYLREKTGCHIIYTAGDTAYDPNFDPASVNPYKQALLAYAVKNRIGLLLDLHGCRETRPVAVDIGTAGEDDAFLCGKGQLADMLQQCLMEALEEQLDRYGLIVGRNRVFTGGRQDTIVRYIAEKAKVPCMQLEINYLFRNPAQDEKALLALAKGLENAIRRA